MYIAICISIYIYCWPNGMPELVERSSPVSGDWEICTSTVWNLVESDFTIDNYGCVSRHSVLLGYGKDWLLRDRTMWVGGISDHGDCSLVSQWGSTLRSPWVQLSQVGTYPYMTRCVPRPENSKTNQIVDTYIIVTSSMLPDFATISTPTYVPP